MELVWKQLLNGAVVGAIVVPAVLSTMPRARWVRALMLWALGTTLIIGLLTATFFASSVLNILSTSGSYLLGWTMSALGVWLVRRGHQPPTT